MPLFLRWLKFSRLPPIPPPKPRAMQRMAFVGRKGIAMSEQINFNPIRPSVVQPVLPGAHAAAVAKPAQPTPEAVHALEDKVMARFDDAMERNLGLAVERLNENMRRSGRGVDKVADRMVITVKDTQSGEVIRQIPDEALLRVAHNIEEIRGLIYNNVS
jgi:flagellar protein FlaG